MIYIDDYTMVDCYYLVHATPVDPCPEHPAVDGWRIGLVLTGHGTQALHVSAASYPTRALRDAAFEALSGLMHVLAIERQRDYEDEVAEYEEEDGA